MGRLKSGLLGSNGGMPDCDVMEASPVHFYSPNPVLTRKAAPHPPRFQGAGEAISSVVGAIDSNRLIELMVSDGIGFVLPRSTMALSIRGADDGRETFLREFFGLVGNVLLAGWAGNTMLKMLGNSVNPYNPHGIPGNAWISAENMGAFQKLYNKALASSSGHEEARRNFIQYVLGGLESGDRDFSIESRLASLKKLGEQQPEQRKALGQMLETTYGKEEARKHLETYQQLLKAGNLQGLQDKLKARWGKLSKDSQGQLALYFNHKKPGDITIKGINRFDEQAEQLLREQERSLTEEASQSRLSPEAFRQKAFARQRLSLSISELNHHEEAFTKAADHEALIRGLTGTVNLRDGDELLCKNQSRRTMLKQMKHFLEQFVDRATHAVEKEHPQIRDWGKKQALIQRKLYAKSSAGWRKLIPNLQDGLVTAAMKSKTAYTWVPIGFSIAAAGAFTFYNMYLTTKKHGGKIFFPGEGVPPVEGTKPLNNSPFSIGPQASKLPSTSIYRNFGNFPGFPQLRNSNGGIIA